MYDPLKPSLPTPSSSRPGQGRRSDASSDQVLTSRRAVPARILARLFDEIVSSLIAVGCLLPIIFIFVAPSHWIDLGPGGYLLVVLIFGTIGTVAKSFYFIVFEYRTGQTLGKIALNLEVTGTGGDRASMRRLVVRAILNYLLLSCIPVIFLEIVTMLLRKNGRRMVDELTGTRIVRLEFGAVPTAEPDNL